MLERYLRHRRAWEVTLWAVWWFGNAAANSVVVNIDGRRLSASFDWWEPVVWKFSSAVVLFALVPAQLAFEQRFPFGSDT
jgi:hypothetical protein